MSHTNLRKALIHCFSIVLLAAIAQGCGQVEGEVDLERGALGKADAIGSCVGHCDQKGSGACWCDSHCAAYGDCCDDKAATCDAAPSCDQSNPAGCRQTGCELGLTCTELDFDECTPSACTCNAAGNWDCNDDCQAPVACVDALTCTAPNPAGCRQTGCEDGFTCVDQEFNACAPSTCECNSSTDAWDCDNTCLPASICVKDAATELLNINEASADELAALPLLGPWSANVIVEYRELHGPFSTLNDLLLTGAVDAWTLAQIADLITV